MGSRADKMFLRMGPHASATDWLTNPAAYVYVENNAPIDTPNGYEDVPRNLERGDGKRYTSLNGYQNRDLAVSVPVHGLSTPAGDGASSASQLTAIETDLLTMLMGASPSDYTGEGAHITDAGDLDSVIADATYTDIAAGAFLAAEGATSGLLHARFVTSVATDTAEIYPDLVDRTDANETTNESSTIYAMRTWAMNEGAGSRVHVGARIEDAGLSGRRINGMAGNMTLDLPSGGYATLSGTLSGTEVTDPGGGSPSYSAPTQGSHVRTIDMPLYIAGALYMAHGLSLDFGCQFAPRMSDGGVNGHLGHVLEDQVPVLRGTLSFGALTAPNEVTDATLQSWQGDNVSEKTAQPIFLQVGRTAGGMMAIYIPSADVRIARFREGGQWKVSLEAFPTRHATLSSMYLGIG